MNYNSPVAGPYSGSWGRYPLSGKTHRAVDYPRAIGTLVRCAGPGKIIRSGWSTTGFGWHIRVRLDDGNVVIYGHLSKRLVFVGQRVARNQRIGYTGNSGDSTGPHLHMEVRHYSTIPLSSWNFTPRLLRYVPA